MQCKSNPGSLLPRVAALFLSLTLAHAQKPIGAPPTAPEDDRNQRKQTNELTDIQALSEEVKELKTQLDVLRRQNWVVTSHLICAPGFEAQEEDYAQARSR